MSEQEENDLQARCEKLQERIDRAVKVGLEMRQQMLYLRMTHLDNLRVQLGLSGAIDIVDAILKELEVEK